MTLPKRLVALLLIYCCLLAVPPVKAAVSTAGIIRRIPFSAKLSPQKQSPTEVGTLTPLASAYEFLSSLFWSKQTNADDENADKEDEGLKFRLSEAPEQPEAKPANKVAEASVLSDAETQSILKRLPPIKSEPGDKAEFALREKSLPPPRTGATVMQPFPAMSEIARPEQVSNGPLEVVRYSPEGDVPIAPNLSVTFSQPMISVTSQEEAAQSVPVQLSPQPPGKWHWIGTKTLLFEPDVRFPMATQYSVSVPMGTKSANGGTLRQTKTWKFTTPPPKVKQTYPGGRSTARDTLMFVEFDQRVDPAAVLRSIKTASGKTQLPVRIATAKEIDENETVKGLVKSAEPGRWVAFRALDSNGNTRLALPGDAGITVTIGPGTPSAEGSRTTTDKQEFYFFTYGPLRMTKFECGYNQGCTPNDPWRMEFSNEIDASKFQESQVRIEPGIRRT